MHKKMLAVRKRLKDISQEAPRKRARDLVWASQCNCAYWHGVFGGLYLNFLRASVYENLIKAENIIVRETHENDNWLEMKIEDRDYDGFQEIVLGNEYLALLLSPEKGGSLWELSYRPAAVNLLDTLSRRPEPYHDDLLKEDIKPVNGDNGVATIHERLAVKEEGLKEYLVYDPYPRGALMDHILPLDLDLESFSRGDYTEIGDFLLKPYHTTLEYERGQATVIFSRRGKIEEQGDLFLRKIILLKASSNVININYDLQNEGAGTSSFRFGIEFNLAFLAGYAPDRYYRIPGRKIAEPHLASKGLEEDVTELYIFDEWRKMVFTLRFSTPAKLWRFPVETISQSEAGLERVYQQSVVVPTWELALSPQENIPITIELAINS
jgi:alpha-amylase